MGEFKAQILGIILVLAVFAVLNAAVPGVFTNAWTAIEDKIVETIPGSSSSN